MSKAPVSDLSPPPPSALESTGVTPTLMTGLFVWLLRAHFSNPALLDDPALRSLGWSPGPETPLLIESSLRWAPENVGARPALIVRPGAWSAGRAGVNDQYQGGLTPDGGEMYMAPLEGTHTVLAIAAIEGGDAASRLGYEAFSHFMSAFPKVRERYSGQISRLRVRELGAPYIMEEPRQHMAVEIAIVYDVVKTWLVFAEAPLFDRVMFTVAASLG